MKFNLPKHCNGHMWKVILSSSLRQYSLQVRLEPEFCEEKISLKAFAFPFSTETIQIK